MRAARCPRRSAFTLVEILIVVIILGIIASIIIGLFNNSARDAGVGALRDNLRAMRSAVQVYMAQHGTYPSQTNFESQMTLYSNSAGVTSTTKTDQFPYGPYILNMPPLPVGNDRGSTTVTSMTYASGFGWGYDATTGKMRANCADTEKDDSNVPYNSY